ncbi:MAG TPA: thioredoxin domain-containing protein [Geobacteraceae bacterium]|nr:thioredoxin domain-containing protein [Geobacteraceae bacterium]
MSEDRAKPIAVDDGNFRTITDGTDLPLLLEFWAPWCPHCRALAPVIEQVAVELSGKVIVGQVNCDLNRRLPEQFNVEVIPSLFFIRGGEVLGTIINPKDKHSLVAWIGELSE